MDNSSICLAEMLSLRCAQLKAEAKFEKDGYQKSIDKLNRAECLSLIETVVKKEMARTNLRAIWRGDKGSNDIGLRAEQEFELYKQLLPLKSTNLTALKLYLVKTVKDSLVQDFLVVEWITQGGVS